MNIQSDLLRDNQYVCVIFKSTRERQLTRNEIIWRAQAEFILERKRFLSLCRMRISLFRMRILVCEVEKWERACEKAMKKRLRC